MIFDTKIAIVVRDDLDVWQKLNLTAFLMSGVVGAAPEMIGEAYRDAAGNLYHSLSVQPVIALAADHATLVNIHRRALERGARCALYIDAMFATGHDAANRAVFAEYGPGAVTIAGIGLREERKLVDKITKGARMHPEPLRPALVRTHRERWRGGAGRTGARAVVDRSRAIRLPHCCGAKLRLCKAETGLL